MKLFTFFFEQLNSTEIKYAVIGDTKDFPEVILGDVDIVIGNNDLQKFWLFLNQLKEENISWVQRISHEITAHYCIIKFKETKSNQVLKPDICTDYIRKTKLFIKSDFLLKNRVFNKKGFFELSHSK